MAGAGKAVGPLLSVQISAGYAGRPPVLREVSLQLQEGEICGVVGESGSGKSTLALAILGLLGWKNGRVSGEVLFRGRNLVGLGGRELRRIRGRDVGLVLQSAVSSLNPAMTLEAQFREAWNAHSGAGWAAGRAAVLDLLASVNLPADLAFLRRYSSEVSVGQAQRVLIAMSVLHRPALLIADEPTSALDLITQLEVLQLLERLNRELGMAILFISHDLATVAALCGRVALLHDGGIVEQGPTAEVLGDPRHPYTQGLVRAARRLQI